MRPAPYCWSEAFLTNINNHDNRQKVMSIKNGCMCSILQQVCFTQELMRNVALLVCGHNVIRRMLRMMQDRRHFLYVAVCCLNELLQTTNTKLLFFDFIRYSLGRGASSDSSDVLA